MAKSLNYSYYRESETSPFSKLKKICFPFLSFQPQKRMPKKRLPIFHKVTNFLKISILVSKMRKPIIPKLIFLKKSRNFKRFTLLKHYNNYGFLEDYEFSASSTPLIPYNYHKKQFKNRSYKDNLYSLFLLSKCLGGLKVEEGEVDHGLQGVAAIPGGECLQSLDLGNDEEESVDQRAERFIERFYQEMRMQRQQSI